MTTATLKDRLKSLRRLVPQWLTTGTRKDWLNSLRRLVLGPQSLERTLALTLGGLVLAAILVLAISAVGLLRKQAEQQALARVQLAGVAAREEIRRHGEEHLTATRGLATRTPLQRLIRAGNRARLELFLRRACASAGSLAVRGTGRHHGPRQHQTRHRLGETRWMRARTRVTGSCWLPPGNPTGSRARSRRCRTSSTRTLIALSYLDARLAKTLSEQTGLTIRLVRLSNWLDNVEPDFKALHSMALSRAEIVADRIDERNLYASSTPLFASTGEGIALLEARLPASESDSVVAGFVRRLGWTVVFLSLLAMAGALLLARRIVRPLQSLAESAAQLGRGDFSASIPVSGGPETASLARTLEGMRRNLVDLTATLRGARQTHRHCWRAWSKACSPWIRIATCVI